MRIAIIDLRALAGKESAVADFLQAHAARSKILEDGCLDFQIANDPDDPANISIIMTYSTAETQAAHRETEHFKRFMSECADVGGRTRRHQILRPKAAGSNCQREKSLPSVRTPRVPEEVKNRS